MLVSEVMLHQTQVSRVEAAWEEFIGAFPTPEAMAAAGPAAVIRAWGRLGYPRRARRLYEAAVMIDRDGWPDDLRDLPGVGRYTAAAVRVAASTAALGRVHARGPPDRGADGRPQRQRKHCAHCS